MVVVQLPPGLRHHGHRRRGSCRSCIGRTKPIMRSRTAQPDALLKHSNRHVRMINMLANVIRLVSIAVALSAPSHLAKAADHGQLGPTSPETKAWVNSLENKLREGCCSTADGWKAEEVEYDMRDDKYRVRIEGKWYDVPANAVIDRPNKLGFPVVWYYKTWDNGITPSISIRCFIPGAGG
jgi:hypothetical protein